MNECFLIGTIINDIEFYFILGKVHDSVVKFQLKLKDKTIISIKAFDEIADYCYSKLNKNDIIFINGQVQTNGEILAINIEKIRKGKEK